MGLSKPNNIDTVEPWYKQGWPWFIISIPAASVLLGFNLLYVAHQTNNSMVVDDYYKEGKSISQYAARDRTAAGFKLSAQINSSSEGIKLQLLQLSDAEPLIYPDVLNLRWVHVTLSEKDGSAKLKHFGGGRYFDGQTMLPSSGRWRVHVEPIVQVVDENSPSFESGWRLVSDRITLDEVPNISINHRS